MSDLENVRSFEYRPSRMKTGFLIEFTAEEKTLHGRCLDISAAGIRAEFEGLVVVGSSGVLILRSPSGVLNLKADVAYAEKGFVGLVFRFRTPSERGVATRFIASVGHVAANSKSK